MLMRLACLNKVLPTYLPTEKIEFDWYGSGTYKSDSSTVKTHENFNFSSTQFVYGSDPYQSNSIFSVGI